jgi:arylsulfatase A-like enzyme
MKKSLINYCTILWVLTVIGCQHHTQETAGAPLSTNNVAPNIIFLLSDDQRYDALGVAGNAILRTHFLDSLAKGGVYFTHACATSAVCCVSRASILSGQYARRHQIWDFNTDFTPAAFDQTFPMLLKKAGYHIGFIGKFGVGDNAPKEKFDYWRGFNGQGEYISKNAQGKSVHILKQTEQDITEFINQYATQSSPFFLQVSFKSPHAQDENVAGEEFVSDSSYNHLYNSIPWQLPETAHSLYFNHFPNNFITDNEGRKRWQKRFSSPYLINKSMQGYYRLIHHMDDVVGKLLTQLREKNIDKNTIVVFASDNGYYLGEYGLADKWFGSEPSIRIPLFVYDPRPNSAHGVKNTALALNIDIAPTILSCANIPIPKTMQGQNLMQLDKMDNREDFFYEYLWTYKDIYIPSTEGVVGKQYKYMRYFKNLDSTHLLFEELYDLHTDPHEIHNLVELPEWQRLKDSLMNRLWVLKKEVR